MASDMTPETAAIWTRGLQKTYARGIRRTKTTALEGLDLTVRPGEIFGFLGHNGAGKSTTIKLLTGLVFPTSGTAAVAGAPAGTVRSRARVGYLPENPVLGDAWSAREFLTISARLAGMDGASARDEVAGLIERLELGRFVDRRLGKMSKGQTQLIGLAHAILGRPPVLILDEPMSGLDPMARKGVRDTLLELRAAGRSIFFSSHILADVELICDRVALIGHGRLAGIYSLDDIHQAGRRSLEVVVTGVAADVVAARGAPVSGARDAGEGSVVFHVDDPPRVNDVLGWVMGKGAVVRSVTPRGATLEAFVLSKITDPAGALRTAPEAGDGSQVNGDTGDTDATTSRRAS